MPHHRDVCASFAGLLVAISRCRYPLPTLYVTGFLMPIRQWRLNICHTVHSGTCRGCSVDAFIYRCTEYWEKAPKVKSAVTKFGKLEHRKYRIRMPCDNPQPAHPNSRAKIVSPPQYPREPMTATWQNRIMRERLYNTPVYHIVSATLTKMRRPREICVNCLQKLIHALIFFHCHVISCIAIVGLSWRGVTNMDPG